MRHPFGSPNKSQLINKKESNLSCKHQQVSVCKEDIAIEVHEPVRRKEKKWLSNLEFLYSNHTKSV